MDKLVARRDVGMIYWGFQTNVNRHTFVIENREFELFEAFETISCLNFLMR
jgi:hypothetical protein